MMKNITNPKTAALGALLLICQTDALRAQSWTPASAGGSTAANVLNFNNGASSPATAAMPAAANALPVAGAGASGSSTPATATSGGWSTSAGGALAVYAPGFGVPPPTLNLAAAQASTVTSPGLLKFNTNTSGTLSELAALSIPSTWSASAVIPGSNSWTSMGNDFQYNFEIDLSSSILSFTTGVFPSFGLLIEDGAGNDLYSAPTLGTLLGLGVTDTLTNGSYSRSIMVNDYDPATGPLKVTWMGSHTLTGTALNSPVENLMTVKSSQFMTQAVPEASVFLLTGIATAPLLLRRRRAK